MQLWRRSYNVAPPGGESLADTVKRTVPFFCDRVLKHLMAGDDVLIAAHGNSLRSIIVPLKNRTPVQILQIKKALNHLCLELFA